MSSLENELRTEIIEISTRLSQRGLIRGSSGNISTRLNGEQILITPTQLPKGYLRESDIVLIDTTGNRIKGNHAPSMDIEFHLAAYKARPDAQAVIHANPVITTAFSIVDKTIKGGILPQFDFLFPNGVPTAPYNPQAAQDLSEVCGTFLSTNDIIILSHHGTLAVGHSLMIAWMLTEHLETCFEVVFYTECLGGTGLLTERQTDILRDLHKRNKLTHEF